MATPRRPSLAITILQAHNPHKTPRRRRRKEDLLARQAILDTARHDLFHALAHRHPRFQRLQFRERRRRIEIPWVEWNEVGLRTPAGVAVDGGVDGAGAVGDGGVDGKGARDAEEGVRGCGWGRGGERGHMREDIAAICGEGGWEVFAPAGGLREAEYVGDEDRKDEEELDWQRFRHVRMRFCWGTIVIAL